ncbi:MAG: MFS transporter, partial [Bacillota bacterium]
MDERRRLLVLIAATAGATLIPLNTSMLSVAMAPITSAFGVSLPTGAWLVLLYLTIMTSLQPVAGKLGDRYGHARIFLLGLLLFAAASAGAALAPSFGLLIALRALQGLAGSALAPNATALIRLTYPQERVGQALGLYVSVFSLGLTVGPVISGLLISSLGWQAVFWINLPIIFLAGWAGWRALPRGTGGQTRPFDWQGTSLFTLAVGGLVVALNLWKEGRLPLPLWVALGACGLAGIALLYIEERAEDPLLRLSLFRLPGFGVGSAAIFLVHTIFQTILLAVPFLLQEGRGLSAASAGLVLAVFAGLQALLAPVAGRLSDRVGRRAMATAAGLLY